jgi:hypothetical protein
MAAFWKKLTPVQRQQTTGRKPKDFALTVEVTTHDLNHRSRRCLKGRAACAVYYDDAQRLRWNKRQRQTIFRWLLAQFGAMIGNTTNVRHLKSATAWRVTVEAWLRCQGLITTHHLARTLRICRKIHKTECIDVYDSLFERTLFNRIYSFLQGFPEVMVARL